jgi:predicted SprT family Zn-dependent metalloprotease
MIIYLDSNLQNKWNEIFLEYFPLNKELLDYKVGWSPRRQKRVLASVCLRRKYVKVAKELNRDDLWEYIEPLLYHEMCHAVLGLDISKKNGKKQWHGKDFKSLENQHPKMKHLRDWIKAGGWASAVRSQRIKSYWQKIKKF